MLMIDGTGAAGTPAFWETVTMIETAASVDAPLEGLWSGRGEAEFDHEAPETWEWTLMLPVPEGFVADAPLRVERFADGRAAEVLHVGPYSDEGPTIAALHEFIAQQGLRLRGRHHEIYLDDPTRTPPEQLRTMIRQPVT